MSHEKQGGSDDRYTPKYIFDALGVEFDMDVASPEDLTHIHVPAKEFITFNSLETMWTGFVWCNPPFSGRNEKSAWLEKMNKHHNGIALTPDRTSAPWWPVAAMQCDALLFVTGKVKFFSPHGLPDKHPSNGTTLFAYGTKAVYALTTAEDNGLGILLIKPRKRK